MLFEKKKIQTETLSEYLSEVRKNLALSEAEVCSKSGVGVKFFQALEAGNFKKLPADVYVYGFLRQLATVYQVDSEDLVQQYKKERGIEQHLEKSEQESGKAWPAKKLSKLVITPRTLSVSLGLAFVAISLWYIIWQVWSINKTPSLDILEPQNNAVIEGSSVKILGKTDPGLIVLINDQNVFVKEDGSFETVLSLTPGQKQIVVIAKNRFDKTESRTLNLTSMPGAELPGAESLQLKASFISDVTLGVGLDSQAQQIYTFKAGDSKSFSAEQKILLSTSDAGATYVSVNGVNLGAMGKRGEALSNVMFTPESGKMGN